MNAAVQVLVGIAGLFHLVVFAMESVLFRRPAVWRRFLVGSPADAEVVRPWAFNQGFYNLFLTIL